MNPIALLTLSVECVRLCGRFNALSFVCGLYGAAHPSVPKRLRNQRAEVLRLIAACNLFWGSLDADETHVLGLGPAYVVDPAYAREKVA